MDISFDNNSIYNEENIEIIEENNEIIEDKEININHHESLKLNYDFKSGKKIY